MSAPERVKRYDLEYTGSAYSEHRSMVRDDEYGDWVAYDDYAAIESRLAALEAELARINEREYRDYPTLTGEITVLRAQVAGLHRQIESDDEIGDATVLNLQATIGALRTERDYLAVCLGEANASKDAAHEEVAKAKDEAQRCRERMVSHCEYLKRKHDEVRAERDALREGLQCIAGGPAQEALCEGPTRRMEHIMGNCLHCKARAALAAYDRDKGGTDA